MKKASIDIGLDDATVGMELAADLVDPHGTVLLQAGAVLTDTLLAALARRGVARLRVVGEAASEELPDARRERIRARLAHLFRHGAGGARAQLRACLEDYRGESR
jgi:hypothetical protein